MAAKNKTQTPASAAGADAGSTPKTAKPRKQVNPDEVIYWNGERDAAIIREIMANPGRLTTKALADRLAKSPAFADDAHLLSKDGASEKIRAHVKKLSDTSFKRFGVKLELKRGSNTGYHVEDTMASVFAEFGMQVPTSAPAPVSNQGNVSTIPSGVIPLVPQAQAQPQTLTPQVQTQFTGGLIPTP